MLFVLNSSESCAKVPKPGCLPPMLHLFSIMDVNNWNVTLPESPVEWHLIVLQNVGQRTLGAVLRQDTDVRNSHTTANKPRQVRVVQLPAIHTVLSTGWSSSLQYIQYLVQVLPHSHPPG